MFKWIFLALSSLILFSSDLMSQEPASHPLFKDDWIIKIGGQRSDADAKIGLASPALGEIPIIDIGEGDADTTVNSLGAKITWQGLQRWRFGLSYFRARVQAEKLTSEDIHFGDLTIPAGTGIGMDFDTDFYVLNGHYDFYQGPGRSAGVGLGIYAMDLTIEAEALVGGQPTGERESADTLAPLPTLSAYYRHAFNSRWAMTASLGYFSAEIDKYDGEILTADLSFEYWPSERWGVGAGFTFVDLDITVDERVFDQRYVVEYDSMFIFATIGF